MHCVDCGRVNMAADLTRVRYGNVLFHGELTDIVYKKNVNKTNFV